MGRATSTQMRTVLGAAKKSGIVRATDFEGIGAGYLNYLAKTGRLSRVGRGLYSLNDSALLEHQSLLEISKRNPRVVICLLSAAAFHGVGTQMPSDVWIAIGHSSRVPTSGGARVVAVRMSDALLREGVQEHEVDGVTIRVTSIARTVVDMFKFRSSVGTDVAVEVLKDVLDRNLVTSDELYHFAQLERVWNIIRPYAEALG